MYQRNRMGNDVRETFGHDNYKNTQILYIDQVNSVISSNVSSARKRCLIHDPLKADWQNTNFPKSLK
jgi:hypothetical protein